MMHRVAILASTRGTVLQAILDEKAAGLLPQIEIVRVLSDVKDCGALEKTRAANIEAIFVDPKGKSREEYDEALLNAVGEVDLIALIGFLKILGPKFIEKYQGRILNVHPALLPNYGGKGFYGEKVHQAVLAAGEKESGMTIHFVEEGVDTGPIFLQKKVSIEAGETPETLQTKVQELEKKGYPEALRLFFSAQ